MRWRYSHAYSNGKSQPYRDPYADPNTYSNCVIYAYRYANTHTNADSMHGEMRTHAEAAPDSGTAAVGEAGRLGSIAATSGRRQHAAVVEGFAAPLGAPW